ncbi:MAG: glycerol-3-phosphate acyltransferase [Dehalococcoidales bacterium]|nr:glycerol-3-phosphate acyltransferase [Dehalococcoidales bacterium]
MWFALLCIGSYLAGALPVSYLAAKLAKGIDLRKYGTSQVGAGNLWRMTSSKIGIPVVIYDVTKGMLMVWIAHSAGMGLAQQMAVGIAAVVGHNWSVFLKFSGGRGLGTAAGIVLFVPVINGMVPWGVIAFVAIALTGLVIWHTSPLPVLLGMTAAPVTTWLMRQPDVFTVGFLVILLVLVVKRLMAHGNISGETAHRKELFINRLFFDRDIKDRKAWMYRKPIDEVKKDA